MASKSTRWRTASSSTSRSETGLTYLNPTANLILELCDGTLTAAQIAELIAQTFDLAAPPDEEVNEALAQLAAEGLTG